MLSVLPRLMSPLVQALRGPPALAALALRTLEYWVDSLNPEFLEPALSPVGPELHASLWAHLRPHPYALGPKALALLGKLGGRGRRHLREPPAALECRTGWARCETVSGSGRSVGIRQRICCFSTSNAKMESKKRTSGS